MPNIDAPLSRRQLHFDDLDQAVADARSLAAAEQHGSLRQLGNWPLGQTLNHLGCWMNYGFDGLPIKIPFFVPWVMKPMKNRMLNNPMKPGRRIPRVRSGTFAIDPMETAPAMMLFQNAADRLAKSCPDQPSPIFGRLTHEEYIKLNLRHCELHLSLLIPD